MRVCGADKSDSPKDKVENERPADSPVEKVKEVRSAEKVMAALLGSKPPPPSPEKPSTAAVSQSPVKDGASIKNTAKDTIGERGWLFNQHDVCVY